MGYSEQTWADGPTGNTPITAARLSHLEDGVGAAAVTTDIGTAGTPTGDAVRSTCLPKWKASTAYTAGEPVLNPSGQTATANAAFTSGTTYSAANWTIVSGGGGGTIATAPAGDVFAVRQNSDASWPARTSTRQDIYFDWRFSVAGSAAPTAATTPGTTTDGTYPGDAIFGA